MLVARDSAMAAWRPRTVNLGPARCLRQAAGWVALAAAAVLAGCGAADEPDEVAQPAEQPIVPESAKPAQGNIEVYAGTGSPRFVGDGGPAAEAGFYAPLDVSLDAQGNLYIATDNRIRRVVAGAGIITTVAGTGRNQSKGDGGPALEAALASPKGIAVDDAGNLYIVENTSGLIRKVDAATGLISTVAGGGQGNELQGDIGDGGPATGAWLKSPDYVAVDREGNLYIATNNRIRRVDAATGIIATMAGTGKRGVEGDGGPATQAGLADPAGIAPDGQGNIFIADRDNHRIRKVDGATGVMTTVAGIGIHSEIHGLAYAGEQAQHPTWSPTSGAGYAGDGGPAIEAKLALPSGVAIGPQGNVLIADGGSRVRKVDSATGVITTVVVGESETSYEQGKIQIRTGSFGQIAALTVNDRGDIFLADTKKNMVHRVSADAP